jgi:hypothetical protein
MRVPISVIRFTLAAAAAFSLATVSFALAGPSPAHAAGTRLLAEPGGDILQIPDSAFSPAVPSDAGYVLDNSNVRVSDPADWPRSMHTTGYSTWGRVTGYFRSAGWQPAGSTNTLHWLYAGHIFSTVDGAEKAWHDGAVDGAQSYGLYHASSCTETVGMTCRRTHDSGEVFVDFVQYGVCLVETAAVETNASGKTVKLPKAQALATLTNIDTAVATAMKNGCAATTPSSAGTPAYSVGRLSTLNPSGRPQTIFRAGEQGYLRVTWHAKHLPAHRKTAILIRYMGLRRGRWSVVASPLPVGVRSTNGSNTYLTSFYAPRSYSALRMSVSIHLLGRWSDSKVITIRVHS